MPKSSDISFSMKLWRHGWSSAILWVDGNQHEFTLTHVFNDPIESVVVATTKLARGDDSAQIQWSDEPGTWILDFTTPSDVKHLINVVVSEFSQELPLHNKNDVISTIEFSVPRDFLIHLLATELRNISKSFSFPHYRNSRDYKFPGKLFSEMERQIRLAAG